MGIEGLLSSRRYFAHGILNILTDLAKSFGNYGDISSQVEQRLIEQFGRQLKADVLVAPHHGSKTSSGVEFITAVAPQYVIFSAGYLNRWQMPVDSVVDKYQSEGVDTFNTALSGMIEVEISASGSHITEYRNGVWPYWFAN